MLLESTNKLNEVGIYLDRAHSMMGFLADYFDSANPDSSMLLCRYGMYRDLNYAILSIISEQVEVIEKISDEIFEAHKKIQGVVKT